MREIKFRAWHKEKKEMTQVASILLPYEPDPRNEFVLMQYTGLKDRNGIQIFESDIVGYRTGFTEEVEFDERGYWNIYDTIGTTEVIGNVFENPELLEKK